MKGTLPKCGFVPLEKSLLLASFEGTQIVVKKRTKYNAETFIKPFITEIATVILAEKAADKLKMIPVFNNVILNWINAFSAYIIKEITLDIKSSPVKLSLQLDESTDVENCGELITFVRYVKEIIIDEEFFFCKLLGSRE